MPDRAKTIGRRLELTRKALGFGNHGGAIAFTRAMETYFELSPQQLSHYEHGRTPLPPEVAEALCKRFGLSLDWIYRGLKDGLPLRLVQQIELLEREESSRPIRRH